MFNPNPITEVIEASQLSPQLLGGIMALNPTIHGDSSPRSAMFSSHIGQSVVIEGGETRMLKTGVEYAFADQTFKVVAPCDMLVVAVFKKFEETHGYGAIKKNPETYVIYERLNNKSRTQTGMNVFGVLKIPAFHTKNHTLGFKYVPNKPGMRQLYQGNMIKQGTVFAHSPNVTPTGDYKYGINANTCFMSTPETEQDGFVVTEAFAEKLACTRIESRIVSWGENKILLNLYGDDENYKAYPEIGDVIRPDGLLFAIRTIKPGYGITELTPSALRTPDPIFDTLVYAEAGAEIIDVTIKSDRMRTGRNEVQFWDKQSERYEGAGRIFSQNLRKLYEQLSRQHQRTLFLEHDLNVMVTDAISDTGGLERRMNGNQIISADKGIQIFNKVPIGDWRAEVKYVKRLKAGVRFKLTDTHGGKGVIVKVIPTEDAPIDDYGNRADIIMDDGSITKRMNLGKPAEQWINGASRWVQRNLKEYVAKGDLDTAWSYLNSYYHAAAYEQWEVIQTSNAFTGKRERDEHVTWVADKGVELWTPTNRKFFGAEQIKRIMKHHDYPITPVVYRASNGKLTRTKDPVLIAPLYIILLEKMGEYWASCSFPKLTHFGTIAQLTQADKYALPWRDTGTRFAGESEIRLFIAACGGAYANRILSFANTPAMHRNAMYILLRAENPMRVPSVIDESKTPLGQSRPLQMYKHMQGCRGIKLARTNMLH